MRLSAIVMIAAFFVVTPVPAAEWGVIGAGNATCNQWRSANPRLQSEILSWMAGFATAMNLDRAAEEKPEYRIEFLTPDYLTSQIDNFCRGGAETRTMLTILLEVLRNIPMAEAGIRP